MHTFTRSISPLTRPLLATTILASLFALGCDPIVMIPGGALSGEEVEIPADWAFTDAVDTVQLETRPDDPYSVNIWCVASEGRLYVAGSRDSTWTQNVVADPRVKLRVGEALYALRATEATSDADLERLVAAIAAKYGREIDVTERDQAVAFELRPR